MLNVRKTFPLVLVTASLCGAFGCDDGTVGADAAIEADASTVDSGPAGPWDCVGNLPNLVPAADVTPFPVRLVTFLDETAITDATIRLCASDDDVCDTGIGEFTVDSSGEATVDLPTPGGAGFSGYARVDAPGFLPQLVQANIPVTRATADRLTLFFLTEAQADALAIVAGTTFDSAKGHFSIATWDCDRNDAAGVTLAYSSLDAGATPFYLNAAGAPDTTLTETSARAAAGVLNVPAGIVDVTLSREGSQLGTGSIRSRAGFVTAVVLLPNQ